jgi:DNA-binding PadR family transcriptional regulator
MKLTPVSYIVLGMLDQFGESTPYRIKQIVAASVGCFWTFQHAQLYSEPKRLAAAGLVTERSEEGGRRRNLYELTDAGREALREWVAKPTAELGELRHPALLKIFFGADPAEVAPVQLAAHGELLAQYEALRDSFPDDAPAGWRITLDAGIRAERGFVEFWRGLAPGEEPSG